ncbi:MAG: metallophosphoesterase [Pseudomonadota bacterium]
MITRRRVLQSAAVAVTAGTGLGGYAFAVEPAWLTVQRYRISPSNWPRDLQLRIAVLADLHIGFPIVTLDRLRGMVERTNAEAPDIVLLLGDFEAAHRLSRRYPKSAWAGELARLQAPLGIHAILGNHDWWEDRKLQFTRMGPTPVGQALDAVGIPTLENDAVRLVHNGQPFWLLGLGDQWAFYLDEHGNPKQGRFDFIGVDDLSGTLAKITDDAPAVLMVHEPDVFPEVPDRVALTVAGHTHGGQVQFMGWAPVVPSRFGTRYAYGHIIEPAQSTTRNGGSSGSRHLVVSGGLGCSGLPVRFGRPPEIVVIDLHGEPKRKQSDSA